MTKEEALEYLEAGMIKLDPKMKCYMTTWQAFDKGEYEYGEAVEAAVLLNELKDKGEL